MSLDAMKQALEALEGFIPYLPLPDKTQCGRYDKAITALRAAIEQAQDNDFNPDWDAMAVMVAEQQRMAKRIAELEAQPDQEPVQELVCVCGAIWEGQELVSAPSQRQWQGLTDEEIIKVIHPLVIADIADEATDYEIARAIEAKLKEKNT